MKKLLMALVVILCAVSTVFAAEDLSAKLDKNKDGKVSKRNTRVPCPKHLINWTRTVTGRLPVMSSVTWTKDEETFIKENDADGDGIIIKKEFEQAAEKRFRQLDKNRNGFISKDEWAGGRSEMYSPFALFTF